MPSKRLKPELCFIEISGACNAKYPYCVKGRGIQAQGRVMPVETFERILKHLKTIDMLPQSGMIHLFNWGEPMLNPNIDQIIQSCGKYGLFAFISSNLIYLPKLDPISLRLLTGVGVSLSGFSDETYGRIHGKRIKKVVDNIHRLYLMAVSANCQWRPHVIWHRYRFNESEMPAAKTYFQNRNIDFNPTIACLNGIDLALNYYFDDKLNPSEKQRIEQDLYTDYMRGMHRLLQGGKYRCPQWSYLSMDEDANLLLCCGWSNKVRAPVFGSVLEMDAEQIQSLKESSPLCTTCIQRGIAQFGHSSAKDRCLDDYLRNKKSISSALASRGCRREKRDGSKPADRLPGADMHVVLEQGKGDIVH
jgi:pyruvate-formate lyase-activating enzyme